MLVAVISDTHGLLRPEVLPALADAEHILHAGDVGDVAILEELRRVAPVSAIRGNIDRSGPCAALPATEALALGGHMIYMLHSLADLDLRPSADGFDVILSGHSHQPRMERRDGVLYLNPGSCGPRRFKLPVTIARLVLHPGVVPEAEIIHLL